MGPVARRPAWLVLGAALLLASGCDPISAAVVRATGNDAVAPPRGPEQTCERVCEARASAVCTPHQCWRGCNLTLDRMVEHEGDTVIACVARLTPAATGEPSTCRDRAWAHCATLVGPHADGGPPAPPPPPDDVFEDGE